MLGTVPGSLVPNALSQSVREQNVTMLGAEVPNRRGVGYKTEKEFGIQLWGISDVTRRSLERILQAWGSPEVAGMGWLRGERESVGTIAQRPQEGKDNRTQGPEGGHEGLTTAHLPSTC